MQITLSTTGSQTKPKLNNLIFHTVDIKLEELKEKLEQGFTISGLYDHKGEWKNTGKGVLKNHYIGSYTVNIDLDEQEMPMEEKLEQITLLPTIAYKTFNNDDYNGKYRYRFIYVFDNIILGESNYEKIFNEICNANHFNYDRNAMVGYKLMCGTDKAVIITGKTYKLCDFKCNLNCDDCGLCKPVTTTSYQFENKEFEKDFARMPYADIVEKYKGIYRNIQQSQLPYADADKPVIELPDDFFEIVRPWKKGMEKNEIVRIKNHCHRRIKLYNNLVIRRLIIPTLSFDELVYALCYEMSYFIDNTDRTDYITRQQLIGIAENAMVADTSKLNYKRPRKSMVNPRYIAKYGLSKEEVRNKHNGQKNAQNNTKIKEANSEVINRFYNPNFTTEENIGYIEYMTGIKFSRATIQNWKRENGYTRSYNINSNNNNMKKKKLTKEEQDAMFNSMADKSIKSIMENMKVSRRTAYRIKDRNSNNQQNKSKMKAQKYQRKKLTIEEQDAMFNSMEDKSAKSIMQAMGVSQKTAYNIINRNKATAKVQEPNVVAKIAKVFYIEKESNNIQLSEKEIIRDNNIIEMEKQDMEQYNELKDLILNLSKTVEELKQENETLKAQLKQTCTFIRHHCINENSPKSSQIEVNNETTEAVDENYAVEPLNEPGAMVVPQEGEVQPQSQEMQENDISGEVDVIDLSDDKNEIQVDVNYFYIEEMNDDDVNELRSLGFGYLLRHKSVATVESKKNTLTPWEFVTPQPQDIPF